jgi:hypothetical protein
MPKVGSKHFSYDASGRQKAEMESQRTGLPIEHEDRNYAQYSQGGSVKNKDRAYMGYRKARRK